MINSNEEREIEVRYVAAYRVAQKSVNLKYYLVLTEIFIFKPASQSVERYHSVLACAMKIEYLIFNNFCKFGK
jgi:hypothetical protein